MTNPIQRALDNAEKIIEANNALEKLSRDPDNFQCYSDHDTDILDTPYECMMCGSTEVGVVGHVLPHIERRTGVDPLKAALMVMHTKSATFFDGILLDYFTASAIAAVGDALKDPKNVDKLRAMPLPQAAKVAFKLVEGRQ
jgi:hypothetical protein